LSFLLNINIGFIGFILIIMLCCRKFI